MDIRRTSQQPPAVQSSETTEVASQQEQNQATSISTRQPATTDRFETARQPGLLDPGIINPCITPGDPNLSRGIINPCITPADPNLSRGVMNPEVKSEIEDLNNQVTANMFKAVLGSRISKIIVYPGLGPLNNHL